MSNIQHDIPANGRAWSKRNKAVSAIVNTDSDQAAADVLGVCVKTIERYKAEPDFRKWLEDEDRAAFQCGNEELDKYFHERASRDMRNKLAAIFILVAKDHPKTIIGFFTLSSQQVRCDNLPQDIQKKTGRYTVVGATLLGRMAIAKEFQGQKHGRRLLFAALYEAWKATRHVMSFAVVVDAKSADVMPFYVKYGFRKLEGNRLIMMMKTIEQIVNKFTAPPTSSSAPRHWKQQQRQQPLKRKTLDIDCAVPVPNESESASKT